jgi:cytochrome c551/c552
MKFHFLHAAALTVLFGATGLSQAAPLTITLPAETAKLRPSSLPGYRIATQKCATCHSADYVNYQPPGMTLKQWTAEMGKMQHVYGAPISDDDVNKIGAYLAVTYGSAKESELSADLKTAATTLPSTAATPAHPAAGTTVADATTLLNANGCLACHGIDKKIVGPGYNEVAAKYRGDAGAVSKLEASIRNGGVGKWGQIPMPPFTQLKPGELRTLAEFVLKQ